MTFQEKLTKHFKDQNITQVEVAEIIGYSPTMVGRYFKKLDPNFKFMMALNTNFDLDWNYLFKDTTELNEAGEPYKKNPKAILLEVESRIKMLKEWHENDTQKK